MISSTEGSWFTSYWHVFVLYYLGRETNIRLDDIIYNKIISSLKTVTREEVYGRPIKIQKEPFYRQVQGTGKNNNKQNDDNSIFPRNI